MASAQKRKRARANQHVRSMLLYSSPKWSTACRVVTITHSHSYLTHSFHVVGYSCSDAYVTHLKVIYESQPIIALTWPELFVAAWSVDREANMHACAASCKQYLWWTQHFTSWFADPTKRCLLKKCHIQLSDFFANSSLLTFIYSSTIIKHEPIYIAFRRANSIL